MSVTLTSRKEGSWYFYQHHRWRRLFYNGVIIRLSRGRRRANEAHITNDFVFFFFVITRKHHRIDCIHCPLGGEQFNFNWVTQQLMRTRRSLSCDGILVWAQHKSFRNNVFSANIIIILCHWWPSNDDVCSRDGYSLKLSCFLIKLSFGWGVDWMSPDEKLDADLWSPVAFIHKLTIGSLSIRCSQIKVVAVFFSIIIITHHRDT